MRGDIVPPKRTGTRPVTKPLRARVAPSETGQVPVAAPEAPVQLPPVEPLSPEPNTPKSSVPSTATWNKKRSLPIIAGIIGVLLLAILSTLVWYAHALTAVKPGSAEMIKVRIEPGSGTAAIASTLKQNGLIRSETAFSWYIRLENKAASLQAGTYRLGKADDVATIVKHLTSGKSDTFTLTFFPGATLAKHRQVLINAGYPAANVDAALKKTYDRPLLFAGKPAGSDLEGYIYGETYEFAADATPEQILERTFDQYESVIKKEKLVALYQARGFNLYQGITLASIIQREVATPGDAAQVAQVFELRLSRNMPLGSDVTYQYIADKTGQARDVNIDSPYNTRRYPGLPPGPISSPGLAALKAVGSPAPGDYLYFLSGDDDKTYFAHTNEEHEQNVKLHCQKKCQII